MNLKTIDGTTLDACACRGSRDRRDEDVYINYNSPRLARVALVSIVGSLSFCFIYASSFFYDAAGSVRYFSRGAVLAVSDVAAAGGGGGAD